MEIEDISKTCTVPVFKALNRPSLFLGVPLAVFFAEIVLAILVIFIGLWFFIFFEIAFHIILSVVLKNEPFALQILKDQLSINEDEEE